MVTRVVTLSRLWLPVERYQPLNGPHFHQDVGIDIGHDPQVEGHAHLLELALAALGAPIGQQLIILVLRIDQEDERLRRAAERNAEIIVEPLRLRRIHLRKLAASPSVTRQAEELGSAEDRL